VCGGKEIHTPSNEFAVCAYCDTKLILPETGAAVLAKEKPEEFSCAGHPLIGYWKQTDSTSPEVAAILANMHIITKYSEDGSGISYIFNKKFFGGIGELNNCVPFTWRLTAPDKYIAVAVGADGKVEVESEFKITSDILTTFAEGYIGTDERMPPDFSVQLQ
jgi:hypothetical protein